MLVAFVGDAGTQRRGSEWGPAANALGHSVKRLAGSIIDSLAGLQPRSVAVYALELAVVGTICFVLARLGALLVSPHLSAVPIWPAAGFALAAVLLRGLRIWPALLAANWIAAATTGDPGTALAESTWAAWSHAIGETLGALVGGYLIERWSDGRATFDSPIGVAKFVLIGLGSTAMIAATIGAGGAALASLMDLSSTLGTWIAWWLRDAAGVLVVAPAVVLWAGYDVRAADRDGMLAAGAAFVAAGAIGLAVLSPLVLQTAPRSVLGFLVVLPLLWAAVRCGQLVTATTVAILSCFAVWGTLAGGGPFAAADPHESFLLLAAFMTGMPLLCLALGAEMASRHRVEARLRQQELILRAMFSQASVGIAQADVGGRLIIVNHRFCEMLRRPASELRQMHFEDLVDPEDRPHVLAMLQNAARTGESFAIEARHLLPDGSHLWIRSSTSAIVDHGGAVRYLMTVAEDVTARRLEEDALQRAHDELQKTVHERTASLRKAHGVLHTEIAHRKQLEVALQDDIAERRKTQEALLESEWRFRMVIQNVTDYAIFMLDRHGHITNWNLGAQRIHQFAAGEIVGGHLHRFYSEEERQAGEPARALQVAAYEGKYVTEGWRLRRDESRFWASVLIEAIRDDAGTLVGFVNITRDITERREAQTSLERAQEQLAQSQKMEALGQLTGSIAHDFNNLLMIVSGHAQLLRRRLTDPKHLQAIDAVNAATNRGESLTRQLLAFSRRQPLNPVTVDLGERVEAVREMLAGSLRGNVQLECDMARGLWAVEVDIAELELALVNIAVNARDAMPGGGTITLSARNVTLKRSDEVDQLEGDFVALSMTDTGVGIAPDVLPKIFEPFFTTKALGKGTGLGLSQVYGFARQSGGTVVATSRVGSGTAITIYLPRREAATVAAVEAPSVQPIVPGQGTVLVVEDNPEVAAVTASLVEQLGYRTLRADNATEALNFLQRGEQIDLVLSDVVMPGSMNGIALAQAIGSRYPQIPVLLTSGYSDMVQTAASQFAVLRKPFQLPVLEKSIREALERGGRQDGGDRVLQLSRWRGAGRRE